jgi:RecB family endonuclease NucS
VGTIDLLARRREGEELTDWLVIELKRGTSGDSAVGQVMRYIGWVRRNLVEGDEDVRGLILAQSADTSLRYSVAELPRVDLKTYSVRFTLDDVPDVE